MWRGKEEVTCSAWWKQNELWLLSVTILLLAQQEEKRETVVSQEEDITQGSNTTSQLLLFSNYNKIYSSDCKYQNSHHNSNSWMLLKCIAWLRDSRILPKKWSHLAWTTSFILLSKLLNSETLKVFSDILSNGSLYFLSRSSYG